MSAHIADLADPAALGRGTQLELSIAKADAARAVGAGHGITASECAAAQR